MLAWLPSDVSPTDKVSDIFLHHSHFARFVLGGSGKTQSFNGSLLNHGLLKRALPRLDKLLTMTMSTICQTESNSIGLYHNMNGIQNFLLPMLHRI